jgi:hypothetical protein
LKHCTATLPEDQQGHEQATIETAKLFLTYIGYDAEHYNELAAGIAAFRNHPNITPYDILQVSQLIDYFIIGCSKIALEFSIYSHHAFLINSIVLCYCACLNRPRTSASTSSSS